MTGALDEHDREQHFNKKNETVNLLLEIAEQLEEGKNYHQWTKRDLVSIFLLQLMEYLKKKRKKKG